MAVDWQTIDYQRAAARKAAHARFFLLRAIEDPTHQMARFWLADATQYQRDAMTYARIARRRMETEE